MQKRLAFVLTVLSALFWSSGLFADGNPKTVSGELVVKLKPEISRTVFLSDEDVKDLSEKYRFTVRQMFPNAEKPVRSHDKYGNAYIDLTLYYSVHLNDDLSKQACLKDLMKTGLVEYAEPRYIPELLYEPNDPSTGSQYYLGKIQAYDAWDIAQGDTNTVIAIVDTGMDMDHGDLIYNIAYNTDDPLDGTDNDNDGFVDNFRGWDMGDNDNFPQNEMNEHGTLCAGLASADTDNGIGIAGPGFKCRLLPVKIQDSDSLLTRSYEGIVYAAEQGAQIISCSWGDTHYARFEQDMVSYAAINKDALVVAACGNDNNIRNFYPASYDYVLSVAATTPADQKWTPENTNTNGGSSFGYHVDLAAPGTMVASTEDGGGYRILTAGTSFATPITAGVAGIVRSLYPEMSAQQCIEHLKNSTDVVDTIQYNLEWQGLLGTGRINMYKAVSDDFQPGLTLQNVQIFDDRDNNYQNSLIVEIQGSMVNFLSPADNVVVDVSVLTDNASVLNPSFTLGSIDSLSSVSVQGEMIRLELDAGLVWDDQVVVRLDIRDGDYHRIQYIEFQVAPSFVDITNGDMSMSIPASGRFGFVGWERYAGHGLNYNEFIDLFFDSGWIVGNNAEHLVSAVRENSEFQMLEATEPLETTGFSDEAVLSVFRAYNVEASLNLKFHQVVYAWYDLPNVFMIAADICNENIVPASHLYAGIFTDWDLVKYSRNRVQWDDAHKIAYAEHTGDVKLYAGWVLLSGQPVNHYALDQKQNSDGLVDLTNGLSTEEKYYCMTHTKHNAGEEGSGTDIAHVFSAGPFDVEGQDTAHVVLGMIVAQSLYELQVAADSLRIRYSQLYPDESLIGEDIISGFQVFPNPSDGNINVQIDAVRESVLIIRDVSGRIVFRKTVSPGEHSLEPALSSGHYQLELNTGEKLLYRKLIVE